jgi:hypothetical protein
MSYDIEMVDSNGDTLKVLPFKCGNIQSAVYSTYKDSSITCPIPSTEAYISVSYNYRPLFLKVLGCNIRSLRDLTGDEASEVIQAAITKINDTFEKKELNKEVSCYDCHMSNILKVLQVLLNWSIQHPNGIFLVI